MGSSKRLRRWGEVVGLMMGIILVPIWPRGVIVRTSRLLGAAAWRLSPRLRRVALANLELAFGDRRDAMDRARIGRAACQSFALVLLDLFWFSRRTKVRLARHVLLDETGSRFFSGTAGIVASGHFGNWEVMGLKAAGAGEPCLSVVASFENPMVTRILNRLRGVSGGEVQDKSGATRVIMRALTQGRKVAFIMDQNTLPKDGGAFFDFFGIPAPFTRAAGLLAVRMGVPVLFSYCMADGDGNYHIHVAPPIEPADMTGEAITLAIVQHLEALITAHPEHWLWMYKRWKYLPPGVSRAGYPYYARPPTEAD